MYFYRGYDSKFGFDSQNSFIWISDDVDYARQYGNAIKKFEIDFEKLNFADLDTLDEACAELDYDYIDVIYNPTEEFASYVKSRDFNAFTVNLGDYTCCCLLDKTLLL